MKIASAVLIILVVSALFSLVTWYFHPDREEIAAPDYVLIEHRRDAGEIPDWAVREAMADGMIDRAEYDWLWQLHAEAERNEIKARLSK